MYSIESKSDIILTQPIRLLGFRSIPFILTPMTTVSQRFNEAEKLKDQGKTDEAISMLQQILAEDETHVLAHLTLARIFTQTGQHAEAVVHAEKACQLEPDDSTNFTVLSVTYQRAWAGTQDLSYIQKAEDAMARSRMIGH
jgi:tetratricopeptide (TPR) repeat protein